MPNTGVTQPQAKKMSINLKSLPTKAMTPNQHKTWENLFKQDANGNRLIDLYYKTIAQYQKKYIRNVKRNNFFILADKKYPDKEVKSFRLGHFYPEELQAFRDTHNGDDPNSFMEFSNFLGMDYFRKNPDKAEEFYTTKIHEIENKRYNLDSKGIVPPGIIAHVNEYLKNKNDGTIQIINNLDVAKKTQGTINKNQLIQKKADTKKLLNQNELDGILFGRAINTSDNSFRVSNVYGKGLLNILDTEDSSPEIQSKRFELMKKEISEFSKEIQIQILKALLEEEEEYDLIDRMYNPNQIKDFMNNLKNKKESMEYKMKTLEEAFLDLIGKRLDDKVLKEDDTPADFATGINNAVTSQSGVDTSTPDTTNTASDTTSSSTNPDFDYSPDTSSGDVDSGSFGGISGPSGSATIPDDDSATSSAIPPENYKVIDILVNDKDTSMVKVKIQNTDTNEVETVDLSDLDV